MFVQHLLTPQDLVDLQAGLGVRLKGDQEIKLGAAAQPVQPSLVVRLRTALRPFAEVAIPDVGPDELVTVRLPARYFQQAEDLL